MPTLILSGCAPIPLAHYLKALGILRLVAESPQGDGNATAFWKKDQFHLASRLGRAELLAFFLRHYQPTAIAAPWNGGSGFYPNDNQAAINAIAGSGCERFKLFQEGIQAARQAVSALNLTEKPEVKIAKPKLLNLCRNTFPDHALAWLDAVFVLGRDGPDFPPLLGTGGNDGRLDFTNNFMQRAVQLIDPVGGGPAAGSEAWLSSALFGEAAPGSTTRAPIGQFHPGAAGGANATSGFDAPSAANPWDYLLMIEGTLLFAAASVKRLESGEEGALAYPFCVRQAGVGYASAAAADEKEARCEMWLPLWEKPATLAELAFTFGEGRAQVGGRPARHGIDFARAAVSLGVDRGIAAFQRYGFQVRNGLAYFATPLERFAVRPNARADLLSDIDHWHDRLRRKAGPKDNPNAPASVARALNQLERAVLELCHNESPEALLGVLAALGQAEQALATSAKWAKDPAIGIQPLSGLRPGWLTAVGGSQAEFRLAACLAGTRGGLGRENLWFRQHLEPVEIGLSGSRSWAKWSAVPGNDVAWRNGGLTETLNRILARRIIRAEQAGVAGWPDWSPTPARLEDISAFIEGRTDDALLAELLLGLSLIDWHQVEPGLLEAPASAGVAPSALYALLRLCLRRASAGEEPIPLVPAIHNRARHGGGQAASGLAARRLRASGRAPLIDALPVGGEVARRTAAALIFPIRQSDFSRLEQLILKPSTNQTI